MTRQRGITVVRRCIRGSGRCCPLLARAPSASIESWSIPGTKSRYTGKHVITAAALVGTLADTLRDAAQEAYTGPLFAQALEEGR